MDDSVQAPISSTPAEGRGEFTGLRLVLLPLPGDLSGYEATEAAGSSEPLLPAAVVLQGQHRRPPKLLLGSVHLILSCGHLGEGPLLE